MSNKLNYMFIIVVLSLYLFSNSLKTKENTFLDMEAEKEAKNELKYGMTKDWDKESIAAIQIEDFWTDISDKNTHFLEEPKAEKKAVIEEKIDADEF